MIYRPALIALAALLLLTSACGRKAPPVWLEPEELPAPHSLDAVFRADEVILSWQYPSELTGYVDAFIVQRGREGAFADYASVKEPRFIDNHPDDYSYRVAALGSRRAARLNYSGDVSSPPSNDLEAPEGLRAAATTEGLRLEWEMGAPNRGFNVYMRLEGGRYAGPLNIRPLEEPFFTDTKFITVGPDRAVYVVRAMRSMAGAGNMATAEGPASGEHAVDIGVFTPSTPKGVDITASNGKVLVFWDQGPEKWIKGYRVYRSRDGGEFVPLGEVSVPAFKDVPEGDGRYAYRVHALGPRGLESQAGPVVRVSLRGGAVIQ